MHDRRKNQSNGNGTLIIEKVGAPLLLHSEKAATGAKLTAQVDRVLSESDSSFR
jgi:hypothetical protein